MGIEIQKKSDEINVMGCTVVSTEQQEEVHSDLELSGAGWEHEGQSYAYGSKTTMQYSVKSGKSITGVHSGYEMVTTQGSFKCEDGIRGAWPSIIVFSKEGTGHIFHLLS